MGFWSDILGRLQPVSVFTPNVTYLGSNEELAAYLSPEGFEHASPASLWRTQPHLRTVVTFLARNSAHLGLHSFERVDETDRRRDRSSTVARALTVPDDNTTGYELIYALVGDLCLYDRGYWLIGQNDAGQPRLRRLPPSWVQPNEADMFTVKSYTITGKGKTVTVPAEAVLDFTGYSPTDPLKGSPTVESLKDTLAEQREAARYRAQVWKRGGRVSSVLERPKDAPQWSDTAREAFREDWYSKFTGKGSKAGGTPILEDGMTLKRIDFSAQEQQFVEASKLSLTTVAAAYHVNPTMIGQNDGANYSNVREFRRMLYGDTLGPMLAQIEARINAFLLPRLGVDGERFYVEFNIAEKLQGSFEEQATAMSTAIGGPWMLRSEGRALMNLPAIDGADELIVPLNVIAGGQASPRDSAPKRAIARTKAAPTDPDREAGAKVLESFFRRQRKAVLSALGAKADAEWWDGERWDSEFSDDLLAYSQGVTTSTATRALKAAGVDPSEFNPDQTTSYLAAVTARTASSINATTKAQVDAALEDDDRDVAQVFEVAEKSRSVAGAVTLATMLASFATVEAGKQSGAATKTWITGPNSRSSHSAMSGETVAIEDNFSNGMAWPGDTSDADEAAGCNCSVEFNYP